MVRILQRKENFIPRCKTLLGKYHKKELCRTQLAVASFPRGKTKRMISIPGRRPYLSRLWRTSEAPPVGDRRPPTRRSWSCSKKACRGSCPWSFFSPGRSRWLGLKTDEEENWESCAEPAENFFEVVDGFIWLLSDEKSKYWGHLFFYLEINCTVVLNSIWL